MLEEGPPTARALHSAAAVNSDPTLSTNFSALHSAKQSICIINSHLVLSHYFFAGSELGAAYTPVSFLGQRTLGNWLPQSRKTPKCPSQLSSPWWDLLRPPLQLHPVQCPPLPILLLSQSSCLRALPSEQAAGKPVSESASPETQPKTVNKHDIFHGKEPHQAVKWCYKRKDREAIS